MHSATQGTLSATGVILLQDALELPPLSPLPSQPYLSAPALLIERVYLEVLSTVHPKEITEF